MIRSPKFVLTLSTGLVLAAFAAVLSPSTAMAKPPHPHYYGGFGVYVGGPRYIVERPVILAEPVANRAVYTLFFKDKDGQTRVYGEYIATVYDNAATNWGGLIEARDALTKAGVECWISSGHWLGTTGG